MQLKGLARVLVEFSPWTGQARSAREFLARATSRPAQATNPDCKVEHKVRVGGEPFVEVQYESTKAVERIPTASLTIAQILEVVQNKAEELETAQKLSAAGLKEEKLASGWLGELGREREVGRAQFIPRQT